MTAEENVHGNPGLAQSVRKGTRPDIITNQVKLPNSPSDAHKEYFEHYREAREYFGKTPFGKDGGGNPQYLPTSWANAEMIVCLFDGIKSGAVTLEKVLSWRKKPKATPKASKPEKVAKPKASPKAEKPKVKPKAKGKAKAKK